MSTTTLRLPEEVKQRIERLASAQGKSAHALMIDTLDAGTAALERQLDFEAEAQQRLTEYHRTGEHHSLEDMRTYVLVRARGEDPPKPPLLKDPAVVARPQRRR